ncbi:MAG: TRL-like family protein [Deferribacteraceae bacterium]|jgi:hypothetical protein|nr:TRL-like family protein [Deferribacteraceae bacterium]
MKVLLFSIIFASTIALSGCGAVAMAPVTGFLYSDLKAPLHVSDTATWTKEGRAVCTSILGLVAIGDCSVDTAAKAAGITKVAVVDYETKMILGVYATMTTIVRGE